MKLREIWKWAEESLTREEINNRLLYVTENIERTTWHLAAEENNVYIYIYIYIKNMGVG